MRFWWVNQKQTYRHEIPGGYMWSPKRNSNGASNRGYEAMRTVKPGDYIFSYAEGRIKAIGVAVGLAYEFPKPTEFGVAGAHWANIGWRVDVRYREIANPIRPKDHIAALLPFLSSKYSPLQSTGNGNQTFYLYEITRDLAIALAQLMDRNILDLIRGNHILETPTADNSLQNIEEWENLVENHIKKDASLQETTKLSLVEARRGQGIFRETLLNIESQCRVTNVNNKYHLIASHTKPWRDCSNEERLDPENGFMLTPTVDHLFDRGFISFSNDGELVIASVADIEALRKMGVPVDRRCRVGAFSAGQKAYLEWHRESILLEGKM
jgi:putative restriction endonuclease